MRALFIAILLTGFILTSAHSQDYTGDDRGYMGQDYGDTMDDESLTGDEYEMRQKILDEEGPNMPDTEMEEESLDIGDPTEEKSVMDEKILDLGKPTEAERSEMERDEEWRDMDENVMPEFDEDAQENSTEWDQNF